MPSKDKGVIGCIYRLFCQKETLLDNNNSATAKKAEVSYFSTDETVNKIFLSKEFYRLVCPNIEFLNSYL